MGVEQTINISAEIDVSQIQSSMDNLNKIIEDGTSQAIKTISKIASESFAMSGDFASSMISISDSISDTADKIGELTGVIDKVGSAMGNMNIQMSDSGGFSGFLSSVGDGLVRFHQLKIAIDSVNSVMNLIRASSNVMVGQMALEGFAANGLSVAHTALNSTILGFPAVPFVLAISGVVAAFTLLYKACNQTSSETQKLIDDSNEFIESNKKLSDSINSSSKAYADNEKSTQVSIGAAKKLKNEIIELSEFNDNSAESMALLNSKVQQFNQLVPESTLAIDEETGALNMSVEALNTQTSAREASLKLQAANDRQLEISKEQLEIEMNLAQNEAQRKDIISALNGEIASNIDGTYSSTVSSIELNKKLKELDESTLTLTGQQSDLAIQSEYLNDIIVGSSKALAEAQVATEELNEAERESIAQKEDLTDIVAESIKNSDEIPKAIGENIKVTKAAAEIAIKEADFKALGINLFDGLSAGMSENVKKAIFTARIAVAQIKKEFTAVTGFNINSPSKWAEGVAEYVDEGMANGFEGARLAQTAAINYIGDLKDSIKLSTEDIKNIEIAAIDEVLKREQEAVNEREKIRAQEAREKDIAAKEEAVAAAKTAEEKKKAQEDLSETLSKYYREDLEEKKRILQEELAEIERIKQEKIDIIKKAEYDEVVIASEYTNEKIQLYNEEYIAKVKGIDEGLGKFLDSNNEEIQAIIDKIRFEDEALANKLQAIQDQKLLIQEASDAEKEVREQRAKAEREAEYQRKIAEAETVEARLQAEEAYNKWLDEEQYKQREKQRQEEIKALDEKTKLEIQATKDIVDGQLEEYARRQEAGEAKIATSIENIKAGGIDLEAQKATQDSSLEDKQIYFTDAEIATGDHYQELAKKQTESQNENSKSSKLFLSNMVTELQSFGVSLFEVGSYCMDNFISGLESRFDDLANTVANIKSMMAIDGTTGDLPEYGTGGVVTTPRVAIVGDVPEAIIPLDRLNDIITGVASISVPYLSSSEYSSKNVTVTQNVVIQQPVQSPAETARAVRNVSKELAYGY